MLIKGNICVSHTQNSSILMAYVPICLTVGLAYLVEVLVYYIGNHLIDQVHELRCDGKVIC